MRAHIGFTLFALAALASLPARAQDAAPLDKYAGYYQLSPVTVLTVTRDDNSLRVRSSGGVIFNVSALSRTEFATSANTNHITFVADAQGNISELVVRQNGVDRHAARMDDAKGRDLAKRISSAGVNSQPGSFLYPTTPIGGGGLNMNR